MVSLDVLKNGRLIMGRPLFVFLHSYFEGDSIEEK